MKETPATEKSVTQTRPEKKSPQAVASAKSKQGLSILAILLALISIVLVLGLGFYGFKTTQQTSDQQARLQTQATQITALENALANEKASLETVKALLAKVQQQPQTQDISWLITETTQLVQMANDNLQFTGNIEVAIAQLKAAQTRLAHQTGTQFLPARQAIANDIATLSAITPVNTQNIMIELNALSQLVATIPIVPDKMVPPAEPSVTPPSSQRWWQRGWQALVDFVKSAVIIRHQQTPQHVLLSPSAHANLVANIQLQIAQAKWALIGRQSVIYQDSLRQAAQWVEQYFPKSTKTDYLLSKIKQLSAIDIAPELPNLDSTIAAIKAISTAPKPSPDRSQPEATKPLVDHPNKAAII